MSSIPVIGPSVYSGNGRPDGASSGLNAPQPTGSPAGPRGPKQLMIERQAREEKKRAAAEATEKERNRRAQKQRATQEERLNEERRATAAGGGGGQRVSDSQRSKSGRYSTNGDHGGGSAGLGGSDSSASRRAARAAQAGGASQAGQSTAGSEPVNPLDSASRGKKTGSAFPHAFERWETLSAHWEGLTSYWIRRLEENTREIQSDPIMSQLSRQVSDLSAAGANLFHGVVELQRLRASSERKFQRWYFDTMTERERMKELEAQMENALTKERQERSIAIEAAIAHERAHNTSEKMISELRRELVISKEEARRAWEELGKREQDEREKTASLREGYPTIVGGVQVVPMMQGALSQQSSTAQRDRPATRGGPYPGGPTAHSMGGQGELEEEYRRNVRAYQADPFVESVAASQQPSSPMTASSDARGPVGRPASAGSHQQQDPIIPSSDAGMLSEEEYEIDHAGQYPDDSQVSKDPYQDALSEDESDEESHLIDAQRYKNGHAPASSAGYIPGTSAAEPVDYTGQAYGADDLGWEEEVPIENQSRLSAVLEEDERSRASASQLSRLE